ncbi:MULTISPECIES: hypothetical protein [unclassified Beijerinckia]|uniref:hypothetical protein n=1 Tax=unclassified Beijerinckia TaxID=2638183 RepID=UPI00089825AC|nr:MULTISPECIES: hypothetical protein [unclassified Beijerinckia]MDH7794464.1 hypothetical protein [Beijerinckia sp. GAS462]SEB63189.1 hypothetical protein SAMN05443249_0735 [Beijerinckia sp. 28-YEA-48]
MSDDRKAIDAIIARQFASLAWTPGTSGNWTGFAGDFLPGAALFAAVRPARSQSVEDFVTRMKGLAQTNLRAFHEDVLGVDIRIFGNVAIAAAGCRITENNEKISHGVEMMLLIKDAGAWRIVAQAWDTESPDEPMPEDLRTRD